MRSHSASSPSPSHSSHSTLRRLFSLSHHQSHHEQQHPTHPFTHSTHASRAAAQQAHARRKRRIDSWTLPELYALRELVHVATNKTPVAATAQLPPPPNRTARGDAYSCIGAGSAPSSSSTATSAPPSLSSDDAGEQLPTLPSFQLDTALVHSKRFYFCQRADARLQLQSRRQFVRLFPALGRTSKAAQRALFQAFDANWSGKIEFEELCEMLARVTRAGASAVREMAALVFSWFKRDHNSAGLSRADVQLLATTVVELDGDASVLTEGGSAYSTAAGAGAGAGDADADDVAVDVVAWLMQLVLLHGRSQYVTEAAFCEKMDCALGVRVLQVLFAPFDVVRAVFEDEKLLHDVDDEMQWQPGMMAYVVSSRWWAQWQQYVRSGKDWQPALQGEPLDETIDSSRSGQEAGDQPVQEQEQEQGKNNAYEQQIRRMPASCCRPGPIGNRDICVNEQLGTLRRGLVEGRDFVFVSSGVWKRLLLTYGGGLSYPRRIVEVRSPSERQDLLPDKEKHQERDIVTATLTFRGGQVRKQVKVELYPVLLQVRLARHDSRHVYLVYAQRFLLHRTSSIKEIVHRMGIFPGMNAKEVSLWLRRRRLHDWVPLECDLESPDATLSGLQITSAQELLVDFRAMDIDCDPHSIAQQYRRSCLTAMLPRTPFNVAMLQPVGNDFVYCPGTSRAAFAKTGDWKVLRKSMAAEQEAAARGSSVSANVGSDGVLVGLTRPMEPTTRTSCGRLVQHAGLRATGLINMGNTCFMNSALQCIVHSPVFREYFLSNRFEPDVNKKNRLGSRGAVSTAFAQLQTALWRERDRGYLRPSRFRDEFTRVCRHFEETRQYDAHEFMVALLDCLHEDLNQSFRALPASIDDLIQTRSSKCFSFGRLTGRGIVESDDNDDEDVEAYREAISASSDEDHGDAAWREYTSTNSSIVVDLFHSQMRSETVCGTCSGRKCTFDPNLFFSLPIPESKFVRVEVNVLLQARKLPSGVDDENDTEVALQAEQRGYWLHRGSQVGVLCDRIAKAYGRASGNCFLLVEVRRNRIKRIVEEDEMVDKLAAAAPGSIAAYERAWTLADVPSVPAIISEYYSTCAFGGGYANANRRAHERIRHFADLRVGSRVDARDNHNNWHSGTVIDVVGSDELDEHSVSTKHFRRVYVHFDSFSSKWNKWFTARDWKSKRLKPLDTRKPTATEVFEVQVVHRYVLQSSSVGVPESGQTSGDGHPFTANHPNSQKLSNVSTHERPILNVFGTPLFVTIASDKTARDMHQALLLQTARFWRSFTSDFKPTGNNIDEMAEETLLPYEVRIVNLDNLASERGELLPVDFSALLPHFSTRTVLALDWASNLDYSSREVCVADDAPAEVMEAASADPDLRADLESSALPNQQKTASSQERSQVVDDERSPSCAIPLTKCMDALMREESISLDDHWICEQCDVPREGTRLSAIWRLPDLVMIQLKRFEYLENQHKRKVRALVDFPLKGLDFSKWMSHHDSADSSVYDLYAVTNHVGGLTRGHYTAYCRYDADFPESATLFGENAEDADVQCSELWFRFDDEKVSEIAAGDVVTDAAYVLFYKRRTLSSYNVLRYAL
ncbi:unnamed protein product [Hyaloperonospora brassicae]|uniref:Ubiquitinyl hydrolase 1 n=1 Tax=Hyaloperonospora brassicae TaxID=162125 RepID=A0AAV0V408_HYABA|nr:unnamed protein product [Hyaloperonospora brassicae]